MTVYALNGLGRMGKLALKPLLERGARIAWINDVVGDPAMQAHLLEFDSVHGRWRADITQAHQPMQVLVGADDELFHPEQFAPVFAQASPKVPVTVVPDAGHITLTLQHQAVQTVARLVAQAGASTVTPSQ